jgi:uncharacterized protein YutE (UPF0331/DUF86 family)
MDGIALKTLREELLSDSRMVADACQKAAARFGRGDDIGYESCAHQLSRLYNAFEQSGLRVAKAFENNIDDERGWHSALLNRLTIGIAGVRPVFVPAELKLPLSELKGFRHVFVHAYDLQLDPEKLALLLKYARQVAEIFPALIEKFILAVAAEQQISMA